jgi:hypothetical protein
MAEHVTQHQQAMDAGLGDEEWRAVGEARRALAASLEKHFPPRLALHLVLVAYSGGFSDICLASSGRADLIAIVNQQLAQAGLEIVPVARN